MTEKELFAADIVRILLGADLFESRKALRQLRERGLVGQSDVLDAITRLLTLMFRSRSDIGLLRGDIESFTRVWKRAADALVSFVEELNPIRNPFNIGERFAELYRTGAILVRFIDGDAVASISRIASRALELHRLFGDIDAELDLLQERLADAVKIDILKGEAPVPHVLEDR